MPYVYSYLNEVNQGINPEDVRPITENEIEEVKDLEETVNKLAESMKGGDT